MRYTGTYTKVRYTTDEYETRDGCKVYQPRTCEESHLAVLDAGARFALGAIWKQYTYLTTLTHGYDHVQMQRQVDLVIVVARETMANIVVGREHIHTSACEAGRADCPIFDAGEEWAKENVGDWIDLSDFHQEYP